MSTQNSVKIRRVAKHVIEYDVAFVDEFGRPEGASTFHANREVTFMGPHTGDSAMQVHGGAHTLWRANDADMISAFRQRYRTRDVRIA